MGPPYLCAQIHGFEHLWMPNSISEGLPDVFWGQGRLVEWVRPLLVSEGLPHATGKLWMWTEADFWSHPGGLLKTTRKPMQPLQGPAQPSGDSLWHCNLDPQWISCSTGFGICRRGTDPSWISRIQLVWIYNNFGSCPMPSLRGCLWCYISQSKKR